MPLLIRQPVPVLKFPLILAKNYQDASSILALGSCLAENNGVGDGSWMITITACVFADVVVATGGAPLIGNGLGSRNWAGEETLIESSDHLPT
ncbi:hypothetical protein KR100_04350 [Synechococcus sp. KORDI-100]|uniref:hypothetical protein n=1 Tax=Synechococcus sp. KORDI-100 TaxID=1280380 RepID=UPI0004E0A95A|nr:hypothetical protein [Synechococcus sp. KORDI-100]AII42597.1 hypothetical protein KR100_04350 [Synechococcus sp. KORDI-100]